MRASNVLHDQCEGIRAGEGQEMELGKQTRGQMTKSLGAGLKHSEYSGSDLEMLQWVFVF